MTDQVRTLAIIGGGAAGLTAAISASRSMRAKNIPVRIVLFEKDDRVGRSILATGNGRCNFSHARIEPERYHHAAFVRDAFGSQALQAYACNGLDAVHGFFNGLGLVWREEPDGRQFPLANKASVVLDVLRSCVVESGVIIECEHQVTAIEKPNDRSKRFSLMMKDGRIEHADSVILAHGGHNAAAIHLDAVPSKPTRPVLGPLKVVSADRAFTRELDNIRVRAEVSLWRRQARGSDSDNEHEDMIDSEVGELMFRKYGLSGICIFDLSRSVQRADKIRINFLHALALDPEDFLRDRYELLMARSSHPLTFEDILRGLVLPRVGEAILKRRRISFDDAFEATMVPLLAELLTCCEVEVESVADPDLCQVQRGGFDVSAFDSETLEALGLPGLFVAGEALDVDGPCGGYNLQWAWSTGLIAGASAAHYIGQYRIEG